MKRPHVLNRSMFKVGGNSAYGTGITSNLVSNEQRIRYNSGGRVGLFWGGVGAGVKAGWKPLSKYGRQAWQGLKTPSASSWMPKTYIPEIGAGLKWGWDAAKPIVKYATTPLALGYGAYKGLTGGDKAPEIEDEESLTLEQQFPGATETENITDTDGTITEEDTATIDLTPSEKEGLKASMMYGAGTGALESKGDVLDVIRSSLLGATKAGAKGVDPTKEKEYRLWGKAQTKRDVGKLERQFELATSPASIKAAREKAIGTKAAAEEEAFGGELPKTGSKAEHKAVSKQIADSEKKGSPKAGPIVLDEDTNELLIWNKQKKIYEVFSFKEGIEIWKRMRP